MKSRVSELRPRLRSSQWAVAVGAALAVAVTLLAACAETGGGGDLMSIAAARGLSAEDAARAVKTFVAPGQHDEYVLFASGGHSGQIMAYGIPSMRLLKSIAVFTPEPWQGYGYGADWSEEALSLGGSSVNDAEPLRWGDSHHPALSETDGDYDGRWIYINDRAHGRIGMVDLADFRTKQVLKIPNIQTSHGGIFATPDTKYVHISAKVPALRGWDPTRGAKVTVDDHLERYAEIYRGFSTWLRVDHADGKIDLEESFQIELPPYNQDLADAGKGPSYGFGFINSYNTEMATGGTAHGRPPLEAGASEHDFDFLHIIDWQKAEQVVAAGRYEMLNGIRVVPLATAIEEGLLFFAPEPRSPHGVDVAPDGSYITVAGKLDPHVTIFSIEKIKAAIAAEDFEGRDSFGVPILTFDSVVAGQVEVGAGPLHTQYDHEGYGYTSLFLESAVAKWSLGPPHHTGDDAWKLVDKVPVHYNIGHLATVHGDTMKPHGKYLVALNKWSIDRHLNVGPLHPQNFQLVDLTGANMDVLRDEPIGLGEPHYAQIIEASRLNPHLVYPLGTSARTMKLAPQAIGEANAARIERRDGVVEAWISVVRSQYAPDIIPAKKGDRVIVHLTNIEQAPDATHGFSIPEMNVMVSLDAGETVTVEFDADTPGSFSFYCTEFCSALHLEMQGWLIVEG
ncbi:MAG TPA: Sec-dependent nitrous-oxide reductase [Thermoanaerobaculia bacterium]|nr:Sec-dependent nitrous-oxide reductase [Thermoanaerobaculia bacterium]